METEMNDDNMDSLAPVGNTRIATSHGVAAIALNMAMQYHRMNAVQDGTLYQQYKLEGKNMIPLHIDMVFETAMQIERHLLASSDRIAKLLVEAVVLGVEDDDSEVDAGTVP